MAELPANRAQLGHFTRRRRRQLGHETASVSFALASNKQTRSGGKVPSGLLLGSPPTRQEAKTTDSDTHWIASERVWPRYHRRRSIRVQPGWLVLATPMLVVSRLGICGPMRWSRLGNLPVTPFGCDSWTCVGLPDRVQDGTYNNDVSTRVCEPADFSTRGTRNGHADFAPGDAGMRTEVPAVGGTSNGPG
jgi:hypothetical protein